MKRDEIINAFEQVFNHGKQEIMNLQDELLNQQQNKQQGNDIITEDGEDGKVENDNGVMKDGPISYDNNENQHPNKTTCTTSAETNAESTEATQKQTKNKKPTTIQIEIISGPHHNANSNNHYSLKPTYKKPCWIGRSTSKKFREKGISLNKDDEVSTTHGKFHIYPSGSNGKLVYTDTGSTNGTVYNDVEIEDNVPLELVDGMVLVVGNSHLLIHLV